MLYALGWQMQRASVGPRRLSAGVGLGLTRRDVEATGNADDG